jgi:hypothetical protein
MPAYRETIAMLYLVFDLTDLGWEPLWPSGSVVENKREKNRPGQPFFKVSFKYVDFG